MVWIERFSHGQPLASIAVGVRSTLSSPLAWTETPAAPCGTHFVRVALVVGAGDGDGAGEREDQERMVGERRAVEVAVADAGSAGLAGVPRSQPAAEDRADRVLDPARDCAAARSGTAPR